MSRTPIPAYVIAAVAPRLGQVRQTLGLSAHELSDRLGYDNDTTVYAALAGRCLLAIDKLILLAALTDPQGRTPNLHWLLTGEEAPFLKTGTAVPLDTLYLDSVQQEALRALITTSPGSRRGASRTG